MTVFVFHLQIMKGIIQTKDLFLLRFPNHKDIGRIKRCYWHCSYICIVTVKKAPAELNNEGNPWFVICNRSRKTKVTLLHMFSPSHYWHHYLLKSIVALLPDLELCLTASSISGNFDTKCSNQGSYDPHVMMSTAILR